MVEASRAHLPALSTGYPKFEQITPEELPVSASDPVGDLYPERLGERVGIEAQRPSILPHRHVARPFELEPSWIKRRTLSAAGLVEAQEQRKPVAKPQEVEVALEVLQLSSGHPLFEPALACELALSELDLLGALGAEQKAGVVHAAQASRIRVVILYRVDPALLRRQFQIQGVVHEGVRPILLLVPQHLPVRFAPGRVVVGDGVDRGLQRPGSLPPASRKLARDQGVLMLLEKQESICPLANDHRISLTAFQHAPPFGLRLSASQPVSTSAHRQASPGGSQHFSRVVGLAETPENLQGMLLRDGTWAWTREADMLTSEGIKGPKRADWLYNTGLLSMPSGDSRPGPS